MANNTRVPREILRLLFQLREALELKPEQVGFNGKCFEQSDEDIRELTRIWREAYPIPAVDSLIEWAMGNNLGNGPDDVHTDWFSSTVTGAEGAKKMHERLEKGRRLPR